jgi:hypothetical protein
MHCGTLAGIWTLKTEMEGATMSNEDEITGFVKYRGKRRIYTADFEADTRDDLVRLFPENFTAAVPAIKKLPDLSYEETALYQLKKLVDDEVEATKPKIGFAEF